MVRRESVLPRLTRRRSAETGWCCTARGPPSRQESVPACLWPKRRPCSNVHPPARLKKGTVPLGSIDLSQKNHPWKRDSPLFQPHLAILHLPSSILHPQTSLNPASYNTILRPIENSS